MKNAKHDFLCLFCKNKLTKRNDFHQSVFDYYNCNTCLRELSLTITNLNIIDIKFSIFDYRIMIDVSRPVISIYDKISKKTRIIHDTYLFDFSNYDSIESQINCLLLLG